MSPTSLVLRDVAKEDLAIFFEHQREPEAVHMAAFTAKDPADRPAFLAHWQRIRASATAIARTIIADGEIAGSVMSYEEDGRGEVTYWLGKEFWGRGLATRALGKFLAEVNPSRPMYARAAKDNSASLRVLEKCGFLVIGKERGFRKRSRSGDRRTAP